MFQRHIVFLNFSYVPSVGAIPWEPSARCVWLGNLAAIPIGWKLNTTARDNIIVEARKKKQTARGPKRTQVSTNRCSKEAPGAPGRLPCTCRRLLGYSETDIG